MKKTEKLVQTKIALARCLEVSRATLDRYLSMPKAPERTAQGWDLAAVADFVAENAQSEETRSRASDEIRGLKAREIRLRCDRLKLRIGVERRVFVKKSDVAAAIYKIMGPARAML